MKYCVLIIFTVLVTHSCNSEAKYSDPLLGYVVNLDGFNNFLDNLIDMNIIISFDGTCSGCIAHFIEFIEEWKDKKSRDIPVFVIVLDQDLYQVEYLMEDFDIELPDNFYMVADSSKVYLTNNSIINEYWNILLVSSDKAIIVSRNPFESEGARQSYKEHSLLK